MGFIIRRNVHDSASQNQTSVHVVHDNNDRDVFNTQVYYDRGASHLSRLVIQKIVVTWKRNCSLRQKFKDAGGILGGFHYRYNRSMINIYKISVGIIKEGEYSADEEVDLRMRIRVIWKKLRMKVT